MGAVVPLLAQDAAVWLGGYDITGAVGAVSLAAGREDVPHIRMSDDIAASFPGESTVAAVLTGAFAPGAAEIDGIVAGRMIGSGADFGEWPLTVLPPAAPNAAGSDGNAAYTLRSGQYGFQVGGEHGQVMPFVLTSGARAGRLDRDTVMLPKVTRTATIVGASYQLGIVTASTKIVAKLHCFSVNGGSVLVTVESGPGFTTRGTFNPLTGVGRQSMEITTVSGDFSWRFVATFTPGTDFTVAGLAALVDR